MSLATILVACFFVVCLVVLYKQATEDELRVGGNLPSIQPNSPYKPSSYLNQDVTKNPTHLVDTINPHNPHSPNIPYNAYNLDKPYNPNYKTATTKSRYRSDCNLRGPVPWYVTVLTRMTLIHPNTTQLISQMLQIMPIRMAPRTTLHTPNAPCRTDLPQSVQAMFEEGYGIAIKEEDVLFEPASLSSKGPNLEWYWGYQGYMGY